MENNIKFSPTVSHAGTDNNYR